MSNYCDAQIWSGGLGGGQLLSGQPQVLRGFPGPGSCFPSAVENEALECSVGQLKPAHEGRRLGQWPGAGAQVLSGSWLAVGGQGDH